MKCQEVSLRSGKSREVGAFIVSRASYTFDPVIVMFGIIKMFLKEQTNQYAYPYAHFHQ
jgi:hypothetical protein